LTRQASTFWHDGTPRTFDGTATGQYDDGRSALIARRRIGLAIAIAILVGSTGASA
jgi:hypothetical protein